MTFFVVAANADMSTRSDNPTGRGKSSKFDTDRCIIRCTNFTKAKLC